MVEEIRETERVLNPARRSEHEEKLALMVKTAFRVSRLRCSVLPKNIGKVEAFWKAQKNLKK